MSVPATGGRIEPRLVDERDTLWESNAADFRIFILEDGETVWAFDVDAARLSDVEIWAQAQAGRHGKVSIALRQKNNRGEPGLIWLSGQPV